MTAPASSLPPRPTRTIANRRMWFIPRDQPLVCPRGHHMKENTIVLEHAGIRCIYRPPPDRLECGAFVWLLLIPGGMRFVAEATIDELRYMQAAGLTAEQCLVFLGATQPLTPATRVTSTE